MRALHQLSLLMPVLFWLGWFGLAFGWSWALRDQTVEGVGVFTAMFPAMAGLLFLALVGLDLALSRLTLPNVVVPRPFSMSRVVNSILVLGCGVAVAVICWSSSVPASP